MRKFTLCLLSIIWSIIVIGQGLPEEYMVFAKKADSLFAAKKYKEAAFSYSAAFRQTGGKAQVVIGIMQLVVGLWQIAQIAHFFN